MAGREGGGRREGGGGRGEGGRGREGGRWGGGRERVHEGEVRFYMCTQKQYGRLFNVVMNLRRHLQVHDIPVFTTSFVEEF